MEETEQLNIRYLKAKALKQELQARKIQQELDDSRSSRKRFYNNPALLRPVVAGVSLSLLIAGYLQYIFLPTQQRLQNELDTAGFVIQKRNARYEAEAARAEFLQEQLKAESQTARRQLEEAVLQFEELRRQNTRLQTALEEVQADSGNREAIEELVTSAKQRDQAISRNLENAREASLKVEGINEALDTPASVIAGGSGWIYIGHYPDDNWTFRNLAIDSGPLETDTVYRTNTDINVRDNPPRLTLFGYRLGTLLGSIAQGEAVMVREITEVGLSKVWARVELAEETALP